LGCTGTPEKRQPLQIIAKAAVWVWHTGFKTRTPISG